MCRRLKSPVYVWDRLCKDVTDFNGNGRWYDRYTLHITHYFRSTSIMDRNARLAQTLMLCSTTPRTTKKQLERLNNGHNEQIYAEAKECMSQRDIHTAYVLFEQLPKKFKNVETYQQRCETYDNLCRDGVIERPGIEAIKTQLAEILFESVDEKLIIKYADAFLRHGFNEQGIANMNLENVEDAIYIADMTEGHRHLMRNHAICNISRSEQVWNKFIGALEKCMPLVNCMKKNQKNITSSAKDIKKPAKTKRTRDEDIEDEEEEKEKPQIIQESQPNPEMMMIRWKTAETFAGSLVAKDNDEDDDNTAGDDDDE